MQEWLNKKVVIEINANSKRLVYIATITNVTDTHITFTDKFNKEYTFRIVDVVQISNNISKGVCNEG